jgi:hypothetical protein
MNVKFLAQGNNGFPLTGLSNKYLDYKSDALTTRPRRHCQQLGQAATFLILTELIYFEYLFQEIILILTEELI